jgi:methylmalonyl-CoA/ethylmalonyl-CoA epimerase
MNKMFWARIMSFVLFTVPGVATMDMHTAVAQDAEAINFEIQHHHVGLSVPNAEESAAWYKEMLGFEVVTRMAENAANKMKIVHIKRGNCYLELFEVEGARALPEDRRDPSADFREHGIKHMAFQVADVVAAVKELKAKGAEIAMEPVITPGVVFAFIRDNAGNPFELIQYKKP